MNPIRHLRRVAGALAGLACAWLGLAVAAPAAFAIGPPPPAGQGATSFRHLSRQAGTGTIHCPTGTGPGRCTRPPSTPL
jgi:hypothetical protein